MIHHEYNKRRHLHHEHDDRWHHMKIFQYEAQEKVVGETLVVITVIFPRFYRRFEV